MTQYKGEIIWINAKQKSLKSKSNSRTKAWASNSNLMKSSWKRSQSLFKDKNNTTAQNQARIKTKNLRKIVWKNKS